MKNQHIPIKHTVSLFERAENMIDLKSQIETEIFSSEEIDIVLSGITGCSSMKPDEPNVVSYGDGIKVLFKSNDRKILKIPVEDKFWKKNKTKIIDSFHTAANPTTEKICTRVIFSAGKELSIPPFRWRDEFQIGRAPEGNPKPDKKTGLYPCLFQFKIQATGNSRLDIHRSNEMFKKHFLPLIPLMRQYCTTNLQFDQSSSIRNAWALTTNGDDYSSEWLQLGYFFETDISSIDYWEYSQPSAKKLPNIEMDISWLTSRDISAGYYAYEVLTNSEKDKFLLGCEWFNKAIMANEPTDQFLFIMIMLEIFLPKDSTTCLECSQPVYGINKKFKTYVSETIGKDWTPDFERVLGRLYSMRSSIAHNGVALAQHSGGVIPVQWKEKKQLNYLFGLGRQFLISWLGLRFEEYKKQNLKNNDQAIV